MFQNIILLSKIIDSFLGGCLLTYVVGYMVHVFTSLVATSEVNRCNFFTPYQFHITRKLRFVFRVSMFLNYMLHNITFQLVVKSKTIRR